MIVEQLLGGGFDVGGFDVGGPGTGVGAGVCPSTHVPLRHSQGELHCLLDVIEEQVCADTGDKSNRCRRAALIFDIFILKVHAEDVD